MTDTKDLIFTAHRSVRQHETIFATLPSDLLDKNQTKYWNADGEPTRALYAYAKDNGEVIDAELTDFEDDEDFSCQVTVMPDVPLGMGAVVLPLDGSASYVRFALKGNFDGNDWVEVAGPSRRKVVHNETISYVLRNGGRVISEGVMP